MLDRNWQIFGFDLLSTEYKRSRQEIKRKSLDTIKLQKKARKGEKTSPSVKNLLIDKTCDKTTHTTLLRF